MINAEKVRVVFMGTSAFAEQILASLIEANYNLTAVYTQPDKKVGRAQELQKSAVKITAEKNNIPVFEPNKFDESMVNKLAELSPDIVIVAAYGKILPENVLKIPPHGTINVHASLLPKYRGASPIQNALLNGEEKTGITIMLMDKGVDTGEIISQAEVDIDPNDTAENLTNKLATSGSELLIKTLPDYIDGKIELKKQDDSLATLCRLIKREDGLIDWNDTAENIYNKFRAFQPWPGIYTFWENNGSPKRIKLVRISLQTCPPLASACPPLAEKKYQIGEIFKIEEILAVQTSAGLIILEELQMEGKTSVLIKNFINGYPNFIRSILK